MSEEQPTSYRVYAANERFYRLRGDHFRANQIWRTAIDRRTGNRLGEQLLRDNCALVKYVPTGVEIVDLDVARDTLVETIAVQRS